MLRFKSDFSVYFVYFVCHMTTLYNSRLPALDPQVGGFKGGSHCLDVNNDSSVADTLI